MSVQVRRRREAASFLSTYVGAQGELIVDTTNNRVQVHDGATPGGWPAAKLADVAQRTTVADAPYTALPTDRTIAYTALTAARLVTLPAASAYPTGATLTIVDESGACSATNTIIIARAGSDTINGAATALIVTGYGYLALESSGASKWTVIDAPAAQGATLATFTSSNASWPVPAGAVELLIEVWGAGGSGAGSDTSNAQRSSGGGGGGYVQHYVKGKLDATLSITIGAGGTPVNAKSGGTPGNSGGATIVTGTTLGTLTAGGGQGGLPGINQGGVGGTAAGGSMINIQGGDGVTSFNTTTGVSWCFAGGFSPRGGDGGRANIGSPGKSPGGGGACSNHDSTSATSGPGAAGFVIIKVR